MSLTLEELKEEIVREYDVLLLCEVLDITPENILEAFEDKLIINRDKLQRTRLMRLNDATPAQWDSLRKEHPAIIPSIEKAMKAYHEIADNELEDVVNKPKHYNTGNIECIEAIEESMSSVAFKGYLKGNCLKYLWRYDYKGKQVEDLQKATWYLNKLTVMVAEENI